LGLQSWSPTKSTLIDEVFGEDTAEAKDFRIDRVSFWTNYEPEKVEAFNRGRDRAIALVKAAIEGLEEKLTDAPIAGLWRASIGA